MGDFPKSKVPSVKNLCNSVGRPRAKLGHPEGFPTLIRMKTLLAGALGLLLTACATSELDPLVLDGHELHASLVTRQLDDASIRHVPRAVLRDNPHLSTEAAFVKAIAHSGSQGELGGEGIRAALYALYLGENELGFYGLEAKSTADANRLEGVLRGIWAHNARMDRARVHRGDKALVVVWTDGVSPTCWEAVNEGVAERLVAP